MKTTVTLQFDEQESLEGRAQEALNFADYRSALYSIENRVRQARKYPDSETLDRLITDIFDLLSQVPESAQ